MGRHFQSENLPQYSSLCTSKEFGINAGLNLRFFCENVGFFPVSAASGAKTVQSLEGSRLGVSPNEEEEEQMAGKDGETQSCSFPLCNNSKTTLRYFLFLYHSLL